MKHLLVLLLSVVAPVSAILGVALIFQQPATQTAPNYGVNAQWTNGVAPGYAPTGGSGLTLNLSAGTANCAGTIATYSAGTLTMTASTTNYVYLNTASSCVPAVKTTTFASSDIPIAVVTTGSSTISAITDDRTMFMSMGSSSGMVWPTFTGLAKYGGSSNWTTPTYADVVSLFASGSCSGYLKNDGTCGAGGGGTSSAMYQITGSATAPTSNFTENWGWTGNTETDFINNYGASSPPSNALAFNFYSNTNGNAANPIAGLSGDGTATGSSSPSTVWNLQQHATGGSFAMGISNSSGNPIPYLTDNGNVIVTMPSPYSTVFSLVENGVYGFNSSGSVSAPTDSGISRISAKVLAIGNGTQGDTTGALQVASVQAGVIYSAAGTALPSCASGTKGTRAVVSDATSPTYMAAYTSGGGITAEVICSYNGSSYSWLTH